MHHYTSLIVSLNGSFFNKMRQFERNRNVHSKTTSQVLKTSLYLTHDLLYDNCI